MLVQMLGMESGRHGIRVNAVCPGDTAPGMATHVAGRAEVGDTSGWLLPPAGRIGAAGDVAGAVAFFVSPRLRLLQRVDPARRRGHAGRCARQPGDERMTVRPRGPCRARHRRNVGIGKACVERLRAEGMTVVFTGRSDDRGRQVAASTGATFLHCDARDREASDRAVEEAARLGDGRIDVLLANAGIVFGDTIENTPEPAFLELLEVNLTSLFRTSRACFGLMRDQGGGSMIHLASDSGIRGVHEIPAYSVTKAGVVAVSELFAAEGAPFRVRANAVCPGDVAPGYPGDARRACRARRGPGRLDAAAVGPLRHRRGRGCARRLARVGRVCLT